jgi:hypothetical protein
MELEPKGYLDFFKNMFNSAIIHLIHLAGERPLNMVFKHL